MAGGKLSARQKMINLMYLVFIAMLAMKMDKKVLTAFGRVNETMHTSNVTASAVNTKTLTQLGSLANDQSAKYAKLNTMAQGLSQKSNAFYDYLEGLKDKMLAKKEDKNDYESMDNAEAVDEIFFINDKLTDEGITFVGNINKYREDMLAGVGTAVGDDIVAKIKTRFETLAEKTSKNGEQSWIKSRFEGFPLVSSITNITKMQSDIKATESEIYNSLIGGEMKKTVSMTNYDAMVVFAKSAYYPNEKLEGKIVLGKNDPTLKASRVVVNGRSVPQSNIKAGQVTLTGSAGNVGEHELKGKFYFLEDGKTVSIDIIGGKYSVIPMPNEAVISADKMNVVYLGLDNPISISIPGVPDNKVTGSAPGLSKAGKGKYNMKPQQGSREVTISASGKLPNGKTVNSTKKFRVKGLPSPTGLLSGQSGFLKMSKGNLVRKSVGAELKDFVYDLGVNVSGFKVKVQGKPTIDVRGTKFNAKAIRAIKSSKKGDIILIFEIKSAFQGVNIRPKKTSQVSVKITS